MTDHDNPGPGHQALRKWRVSLAGHVYHLTTRTHLRLPLFQEFSAARVIARCLNERALLGESDLLAWVVMPDHMHLLVQLGSQGSLAAYVNRLKGVSSRRLNQYLGRTGPVWQRAFHDHLLRKEEDLATVARYIIANPLRAGLVDRIGDYPHWDVKWLRGD